MLIIEPVQNKDEQERICEACSVNYKPEFLAYSAKEDDKLLGVLQFRLNGEYGEIYDLANAVGVDDRDALVIMGRAALNFIDLCGVGKAKIFGCGEKLPRLLEFALNKNNEFELDLEGYFTAPCQREKNMI